MRVSITGYFTVPDDHMEGFNRVLETHIALGRMDPGCLRFEVTQDAQDQNRYNVDELFADMASFNAHIARVKKSQWWAFTKGFERRYHVQEHG